MHLEGVHALQTCDKLLSLLAGVTEVEGRWLSEVAAPLVALSEQLQTPPPHYSRAIDAVVASHGASFGRHAWALPPVERPVTEPATQARCNKACVRTLPNWCLKQTCMWPPLVDGKFLQALHDDLDTLS